MGLSNILGKTAAVTREQRWSTDILCYQTRQSLKQGRDYPGARGDIGFSDIIQRKYFTYQQVV